MEVVVAIISTVREDGLKRHFSTEREISKLMFAFDHIKYAGYITYQHVYLNNLLRKDNNSISIHGDLVIKHFKKKPKELLGLFPQVIGLIFIYKIN